MTHWDDYIAAAERIADLPTREELEFDQLAAEQQQRRESTRVQLDQKVEHAGKVRDNSNRFTYLARPTLARIDRASWLLNGLEPSDAANTAEVIKVSWATGRAERALAALEKVVAAEVSRRDRRKAIRTSITVVGFIVFLILAFMWIF